MKKIVIILISIFMFKGCFLTPKDPYKERIKELNKILDSKFYTPEYIFNLESVIRDGKKIAITDKNKLTFEDENISINFKNKHKYFIFELQNKKSSTMKFIWDEIIFVGIDGSSQGVINKDIRFINKNDPIPFSNIAPNSKLNNYIIPKEKIFLFNNEWLHNDMLTEANPKYHGNYSSYIRPDVEETGKQLLNKEIKLLIPLKIGDTTKEYLFSFLVKDYKVVDYNKIDY